MVFPYADALQHTLIPDHQQKTIPRLEVRTLTPYCARAIADHQQKTIPRLDVLKLTPYLHVAYETISRKQSPGSKYIRRHHTAILRICHTRLGSAQIPRVRMKQGNMFARALSCHCSMVLLDSCYWLACASFASAAIPAGTSS
jgi:hypothetical protein